MSMLLWGRRARRDLWLNLEGGRSAQVQPHKTTKRKGLEVQRTASLRNPSSWTFIKQSLCHYFRLRLRVGVKAYRQGLGLESALRLTGRD